MSHLMYSASVKYISKFHVFVLLDKNRQVEEIWNFEKTANVNRTLILKWNSLDNNDESSISSFVTINGTREHN